ncbi:MAG: polymer-forming cytoskeletal protein [Anaerolineae bacterium]|nr:polymer-forming cytoskeletal protein [Anaerolineae bacterium]
MSFFGSRRQVDLPPAPAQSSERKPPVTVSAQQPVGFETVLGASSVVEGKLSSSTNVRLDGNFTGTLEITGNVLVGETARINADVNARNISIAGAVRGNVSGKKVQILRTGRVWGDIHAQALTTEEGAFIDGKITMTRPDITGEVRAEVPTSDVPADSAPQDAAPAAEPLAASSHEETEALDAEAIIDSPSENDDSALILDDTESDKPTD